MIKDRQQAILEAVKNAKNSQFKATAIKVELEAQLNRTGNFSSTADCHDWIMARLMSLGLADTGEGESETSDWDIDDDDYEDEDTGFVPRHPLKFARFYNDGSVDSEFTFTLMLDNPENIFLLPKIVKIFKDLAKANGRGVDVRGAGMHMAWINSSNGSYPTRYTDDHLRRLQNFTKSMRLLLPALYFLGTSNATSRGLSFRRPDIGFDSHRCAIDYRGGALEFRVFDTCYDNPDAILDNVVVMSKCLRYWRDTYRPSGLAKVTSKVKFGIDSDNTIERLYVTHVHLDLLNQGLARLKPSYYTIKEIKQQRKFTTTKTHLQKKKKDREKMAVLEYKEYEDRFEWQLIVAKADIMYTEATRMRESRRRRAPNEKDAKEMEKTIQLGLAAVRERKLSVTKYVADKLSEFDNNQGQYTLTA